jgi:hypothetical protein
MLPILADRSVLYKDSGGAYSIFAPQEVYPCTT